MNNTANVSVGKPRPAGGIYRAPIGTALPTDANTALDPAYKSAGYIAEGGVTNSYTITTEAKRAWGGDLVIVNQTEYTDTFAFGLIEVLNPDALEIPYGSGNVSGTLDTGITIRANGADKGEYVYVIDMIMRGGVLKRVVIPDAAISELGDIVYQDNEAVSYPVTLMAQAYAGYDGDTHREYIYKP